MFTHPLPASRPYSILIPTFEASYYYLVVVCGKGERRKAKGEKDPIFVWSWWWTGGGTVRYGTVRYGKGAKVMNDGEGDGLRGELWELGKGEARVTLA